MSKGNLARDWDPMRDDFNDSTYDLQYADENASGGVQLDHCKLYVTNIIKGITEDGLRTVFAKHGTVEKVFLNKDPNKRYAFINFETASEAKLAMMKLNKTEPLRLNIAFGHLKKNNQDSSSSKDKERRYTSTSNDYSGYRDDSSSVGRRSQHNRKPEEQTNGDKDIKEMIGDEDYDPSDNVDLELEQLELEQLKLQEAQIKIMKQMLLSRAGNRMSTQKTSSSRSVMPGERIVVVRNVADRVAEIPDNTFSSAAGDSRALNTCTCQVQQEQWNDDMSESGGSSTPSTCVLCSEDRSLISKDSQGKFTKDSYVKSLPKYDRSNFDTTLTKSVDSRKSIFTKCSKNTTEISKSDYSYVSRANKSKLSDVTSKGEFGKLAKKSYMTCDIKHNYYNESDEEEDETDRLIQIRNADYMDIVEESLKVVVALSGYPKSKMRLQYMEKFQRCLTDVLDMQLKAGLVKKTPTFLDYYLNRGAIVCICKDIDSRDWLVRVSPGLQERMNYNLILLKTRVKRLCLAVMKIPRGSWPGTAQDAFKLLQYFNPTLKTHLWKVYAEKLVDDLVCTSFLVDKVSGEIIRGSTFKNVIDYTQMEFELSGFTEIYYLSFLSDMEEDLSSVASRVKLLQEIRSNETTPRIMPPSNNSPKKKYEEPICESDNIVVEIKEDCPSPELEENVLICELEKELESPHKEDKVTKHEEERASNKEVLWTEDTNEQGHTDRDESLQNIVEDIEYCEPISTTATSDQTESAFKSTENLVIDRNSNLNIDSNRGIAYHRRTNYLHVENELKIAVVLEGYPQNKLEGTHIRRLKHLFKEYLQKDLKLQRFTNLIIPKFLDIYLSNGAVIYICDSLETKDYITEILPKLIKSTGLKLTFWDMKDLVRYTRIIMRLPKELSHVESLEILLKLKEIYPRLKPDCWKYYSDVAGKQKRQFGVDPESLDVIKSPDFEPIHKGEKLEFRIIDRQKRDLSFDNSMPVEEDAKIAENTKVKKLHERILRSVFCPVDPTIMNAPLTRIRANHYSDLIPDDLKLYVGPANYPENRIDEVLFHSIKRTLENIIFDTWDITKSEVPKLHDIYLFDGVIFVICKDMSSRFWIEEHVGQINKKLQLKLKATEFRGAVGIVSLLLKTTRDTDYVISTLQEQNPRLRTKYWRTISTVKSYSRLDVVLQIDKLSAQVITSPNFNATVEDYTVQFKLGHLKSLLNPKLNLEELNKPSLKKNSSTEISKGSFEQVLRSKDSNIRLDTENDFSDIKVNNWDLHSQNESTPIQDIGNDSTKIVLKETYNSRSDENRMYFYTDLETKSDRERNSNFENASGAQEYCTATLKIPKNILPDSKDGLDIIFDLLEDKNPGLNTELWKVKIRTRYTKGKFNVLMDKQSASVIKSKNFDSTLGGEKIKFIFLN